MCGNPAISLGVRLMAAFGARTRCRRCGSVLRAARAVRWARLPFDAVAIVGALWLMAHTSRGAALLLFVGVSALPVLLGICWPLEADPRDPLTRRAIARRS